jgi:hypothetical protein
VEGDELAAIIAERGIRNLQRCPGNHEAGPAARAEHGASSRVRPEPLKLMTSGSEQHVRA